LQDFHFGFDNVSAMKQKILDILGSPLRRKTLRIIGKVCQFGSSLSKYQN
jgi:predicted transcriptional regulator